MEQYIIKGGNPLVGEVEIGGAKNAALAILAAAIMTDETVHIENLPDVRDINVLLEAIKALKIDPAQSIMVGDKIEDLKAGIGAKVKTNILVRTGKPITEEGENLADYVLDSIADLPRIAKRLIK